MANRRLFVTFGFTLPLGGCDMQQTYRDVSHEKKYQQLAGAQYRVIDTLFAYGIRRHSKAAVEYVVLQPPPGFTGSEVGFKRSIPIGTIFKVKKVFMTNRWFDPPLSLEVKLLNQDLQTDVRVMIDVMVGNELAGTNELNPKLYQKL